MLIVIGASGGNAVGHRGDNASNDVLLYPACIAEVRRALAERHHDGGTEHGGGLICQDVVVALQQPFGNLHQLVGIVVGEAVLVGEAAHQSGVGVEHRVHLFLVAGEDDEHIGVGLREHGEQRVDDTRPEVLTVSAAVVEIVGLVDEEYITPGLFEHGLHVLLRLTDVAPHESGAVNGDHLSPRE